MNIARFASKTLLVTAAMTLTMSPVVASELTVTQKQQDLEKIRTFLYTPDIKAAMETKHDRDVEQIYTKVEKLSDKQIHAIAENTPETLQFGADQYESKTAENISDKWLDFADKWLMIGLGLSVLLILML